MYNFKQMSSFWVSSNYILFPNFASVKKLIFIPVLFAVVFQSTAKLAILLRFKANQKYIASMLCVKREIKNNNCKGLCCLKRELEKQQKSEAPLQNLLKEKSTTSFCSSFKLMTFITNARHIHHYTPLLIAKPISFSNSLFHPPSC